jgi:hypothetical protein
MAREEREPGAVRRRNSDDVCSYSWNTGAEFSFQVMAFRSVTYQAYPNRHLTEK